VDWNLLLEVLARSSPAESCYGPRMGQINKVEIKTAIGGRGILRPQQRKTSCKKSKNNAQLHYITTIYYN